ncbi:protein EARLY FLOWERING 4-like [Eucalyptus grandis]|uniref:Uncharacterized protein n=2 Tax=Eucalyptus grandis TaxID=71139 RepID=A0ACC3J1A6_EUCGR|nr:protein EARLY FLOWERING 4-like [Eucalyptus grandis]KAK3407867.1 hypothetical protein EUGRSUZ_J00211 [Eucalyptus grandis]
MEDAAAAAAAAAAANNRRHCPSSAKANPSTVTTATTARAGDSLKGSPVDVECDPEVWEMFNKNFRQVQTLLDRNRSLIRQVNDNHQSKSAKNMVKNEALIHEINQNISKVVSLYPDLSTDFSSAFHQRETSGTGSASKGSSP